MHVTHITWMAHKRKLPTLPSPRSDQHAAAAAAAIISFRCMRGKLQSYMRACVCRACERKSLMQHCRLYGCVCVCVCEPRPLPRCMGEEACNSGRAMIKLSLMRLASWTAAMDGPRSVDQASNLWIKGNEASGCAAADDARVACMPASIVTRSCEWQIGFIYISTYTPVSPSVPRRTKIFLQSTNM